MADGPWPVPPAEVRARLERAAKDLDGLPCVLDELLAEVCTDVRAAFYARRLSNHVRAARLELLDALARLDTSEQLYPEWFVDVDEDQVDP